MAGPLAIAALAAQLIGNKQVGGAAPPPPTPGGTPGFNPQGATGLLGGNAFNNIAQQFPLSGIGLLSQLTSEPPASQAQGETEVGPPAAEVEQPGPPEAPPPEGLFGQLGQFGGDFFGSLDQSLQSPSKLLGIGLLNQFRPGVGTGLLAGKGLLDALRR